jgi:integrase
MSLGGYPEVTLREARALKDEARALVAKGAILTQAEKLRGWFHQMFRFALVEVPGLQHNPAFDLDVVAIPAPPVRHNPHLRLEQLPECLRMLCNYPGRLNTQLGLRTGELRLATPAQFHLDHGPWIIPQRW